MGYFVKYFTPDEICDWALEFPKLSSSFQDFKDFIIRDALRPVAKSEQFFKRFCVGGRKLSSEDIREVIWANQHKRDSSSIIFEILDQRGRNKLIGFQPHLDGSFFIPPELLKKHLPEFPQLWLNLPREMRFEHYVLALLFPGVDLSKISQFELREMLLERYRIFGLAFGIGPIGLGCVNSDIFWYCKPLNNTDTITREIIAHISLAPDVPINPKRIGELLQFWPSWVFQSEYVQEWPQECLKIHRLRWPSQFYPNLLRSEYSDLLVICQ